MKISEDFDFSSLTPSQRLDLISRLWSSLDDKDVPLTDAQRDELDRRIETLDEDMRDAISWEDLKAEMERRCP